MNSGIPRKRSTAKVVALFMLILMLFTYAVTAVAEQGEDTPKEVNIILLLDNTGSMNGNDGNKISIASAQNFIEYLAETMRVAESFGYTLPDINIGVYTFSDKAEEVCGLTDISGDGKLAEIIQCVQKIEYRPFGTGATYYGPALRVAYGALPTSKSDCKNLVFMFTDGKPDGKNADSAQNRPDEVIKDLSDYNVEVMVLGLDVKQSIGDTAKQMIYKMANDTQRTEGIMERPNSDKTGSQFKKANYLIATEINEDLHTFLMNIISDKIGLKIDRYEGKIDVDKREIVIVNVFATSDDVNNIEDVNLRYGGEDVHMEETDSYYSESSVFEDNTFTILHSGRSAYITMYAPALGEYSIELPTNVDYIAYYKTIEMAREYKVSLSTQLSDELPNECSYSINAVRVVDGNEESPNGDLLKLISVKVIGEDDMHTRNVSISDLVFDSSKGSYEGCFTAGLPGKYRLIVSVDDDYIEDIEKKASAEEEIILSADGLPNSEFNLSIIVGNDMSVDFPDSYYFNWPGIEYRSTVESSDPEIVSVSDGEDSIHGVKIGNAIITDTIEDQFGNKYVVTYNVKVIRNYIPFIIIGAAALIAIIVIAFIIWWKTDVVRPGNFKVDVNGRIYLPGPPRGRVISAYDVIMAADALDIGAEPEKLKDLKQKLKQEKIYIRTLIMDVDGIKRRQKVYCDKNGNDLSDDTLSIDFADGYNVEIGYSCEG